MNLRLPAIFLSHGGGPMPLMKDPSHAQMLQTLSQNGRIWKIFHDPNVKAVVVVSAHYVAADEAGKKNTILVQHEANPKLYFDYYGFPPETYKYSMSNPGSIPLAEKIVSIINSKDQCSSTDALPSLLSAESDKRKRGYDHGVFVPMLAVDAPSHLPVVTVSLANDHDVKAHLELGRKLAPLREEGVLLVGSGLSFHNLNGFFSRGGSQSEAQKRASAFDKGLGDMVAEGGVDKLEGWKEILPWSEYCHPRAEHLMPLFVVLGSALESGDDNRKDRVHKISFDVMAGIAASHFVFE